MRFSLLSFITRPIKRVLSSSWGGPLAVMGLYFLMQLVILPKAGVST